jgi:lipopolysaccharide transport system ATP-binding protein
MSEDILIKCDHVSKKFCKDLKRSLWYGLKDVGLSLKGHVEHHNRLRKDEFWAVHDVSFELQRGECLGLIGHNGAGKSTLLKMLNGLINPDQGTITMKGRVGALIELGAGFNPILTGRENIYNNGAVLGFTKEEINRKFDAIVDFAEIREFIDTPIQNYSSGMKVRLGFAIASQMEPDILLIDEVLAVGDLGFQIKCFNVITELLSKCAVIFVTHSMPNVMRICDQSMYLDRGKQINNNFNLIEGVNLYYSRFGNSDKKDHNISETQIENLKVVVDHQEIASNDIISNFTIFIVSFAVHNISKNGNDIRLIVTSQDFRPIIDCFSRDVDFEIKNDCIVTIKLPEFKLRSGKYNMSISISDKQSRAMLYRGDNLFPFQVSSNQYSWADTLIDGTWGKTIL